MSRIKLVLFAGLLAAAAWASASGVQAAMFTFTNLSGAYPYAGLILSGNTLYGTANIGGSSGNGVVFALATNGTGFTTLHSFTGGNDGANPNGGLILSGNTLYGTTYGGGTSSNGTVFAVHIDGTGFTTLHSFSAFGPLYYTRTNRDGAHPYAGLILSGNTLYGTTCDGGAAGNGTVFALHTDGTSFINLHSFTYDTDGANPTAGLVLSGNTLYGTAANGGLGSDGAVFAVHTDGTGFTNLYHFSAYDRTYYTNSDGANPFAGLILSGNILYGTAEDGGRWGAGAVFAVRTDGTGFTNLHNFTAYDPIYYTNSDGANPIAGLMQSGNTLYGTAYNGGGSDNGTVFSLPALGPMINPAPQMTIMASGINIVLTWPTDATGFTLQSTTNLGSPASWTPVSTVPVIVNGQNTVSNSVSGLQQFYRLMLSP